MWLSAINKELINFDQKLLEDIKNLDNDSDNQPKNNRILDYLITGLLIFVIFSSVCWYSLSFYNNQVLTSEICSFYSQKNEDIKLNVNCQPNLWEQVSLQATAQNFEIKYLETKSKLEIETQKLEEQLKKEIEIATDFGIDSQNLFSKTGQMQTDVSKLKIAIENLQIKIKKLIQINSKNYQELVQIVNFVEIEQTWLKNLNTEGLIRQNSFKIEDTLKNLKNKLNSDILKSALSYKYHTPAEFVEIFESANLPNIQALPTNIEITESKELDEKIYKIANQRGYKNRGIAKSTEFCYEEKIIKSQMNCQIVMKKDIENLLTQSKKKKNNMVVTSVFRNLDDQKTIFVERLAKAVKEKYKKTDLNLADDELINEVLKTTSPPNYSKHHTGYTIDFADLDNKGFTFENSDSYSWLRANNFLVARENGFIPSYPKGVSKVGPEPESWEFVWVGKEKSLQTR